MSGIFFSNSTTMTRKNRILFKGIVKNGKQIYDHPDLRKSFLEQIEGQRFEEITDIESKPKTRSQLGYLWGGIIEATCMASNVFAGWNKEDICDYLLSELTSYPKEIEYPDGHRKVMVVHDRLIDYDKEQLKVFIDRVIIFLADTHKLVVLTPDEYMTKKYFTKIEEPAKEW